MYLLPAIDILEGHAVRLERGDYTRVTVYDNDPVLRAQLFEEDGASWIHVVDLDGARSGIPANISVIERILKQTNLKVEVGGGIRTLDTARRILDTGADRVIFGTALVKDPDLAQAAIEEFGAPAVVAGIDAEQGEVKVEGWIEGAKMKAHDLATRMAQLGYEHLVYTDIARDGMQTGVSLSSYTDMAQAFGNPVIASGGISSVHDITELATIADAIEGVIAGRAIYEGSFTVADGVAACKGTIIDEPHHMESLERPLTLLELED